MAKSRAKKQEEFATLLDRMQRMKSVIFSSYEGLTVPQVTKLRKELKAQGVDYQVVKKTLLARALTALGRTELSVDALQGGVALAFGFEDEVLPAKLLDTFRKEHKVVTFLGGFVQHTLYDGAAVERLAKLPSRQELIAKLLGTIQNPLRGFLQVSSGPMRGFARVLQAASERS